MKPAPGYIALISVTIILSVVVVIGVLVTVLTANGLVAAFTTDQGMRAFYVADSCAYEAMVRIKRIGLGYIGTHTLTVVTEGNYCTIIATAGPGTTINVQVTGVFRENYYHAIALQLETNPFTLISWQETE
ncbi:MAG: hypothetical protein HYV33_05920 [Candidatus Kerfeldbacteria bacterium]|nr:hypothetical protein [Candidatus Kerfeldbacteria bacterium]